MKHISTTILLIITWVSGNASAQDFEVKAGFEKDSILIGDQVGFMVSVKGNSDKRFEWPVFTDTLVKGLEFVNQPFIDTLLDGQEIHLVQKYLITSFDSGWYWVPPVQLRVFSNNDTVFRIVQSLPSALRVSTIPVDTTQAIKPIKGPVSAPITFTELLPWILTTIGIAAGAFLVMYFVRNRKNKEKLPWIRPKPKLPAHIQALNDLEKLRLQRLWQSGMVKDYYIGLTNILRVYIENRFSVKAMEMVSDEIVQSMKNEGINHDLIAKLARMLSDADLVKFAKASPLPSFNDLNHKIAVDFIKETIPAIMEENMASPEKEIIVHSEVDSVKPIE